MPVYLCQPPDLPATEPWRRGIQVYAEPFDMVDLPTDSDVDDSPNTIDQQTTGIRNRHNQIIMQQQGETAVSQIIDVTGAGGPVHYSSSVQSGLEIRRIRHAEVVLVDDVCVAFGRHWLRLRWPGHKGGFAGYVALGKVDEPMPKQISHALQGTCDYYYYYCCCYDKNSV
jgi:hypothetical protein